MKTEKKIPEKDLDYRPRFYISGNRKELRTLRPWITDLPGVTATCFEKWKTSLYSEKEERVLRVDVEKEGKVMETVNRTKKKFSRSRYRFYNVNLSQQFRYCLQRDQDPTQKKLEKMELSLPRKKLADEDISGLEINGEKAEETKKRRWRSSSTG